MDPNDRKPEMAELDEKISKDLVEYYGDSVIDAVKDNAQYDGHGNPNYQDSILRDTVEGGISRACKRCGSLVQQVDFKLHDEFHNQIDGMISNLLLAHDLIDMLDDRVRRRYNQRNNMNSVTEVVHPGTFLRRQ